ncbi:helix-turn-helix transcriptional regulator [Streptomyces sp. NPDC001260]|uniref:helix-turn-helix transcriptional regulator n=1 Tax=Streptomyces sp. NPDC001260 TaxID=3364551 RepID=UPI0036CBC11B
MASDKLLSSEDLADYLGVPVATIHQWSHRGIGPQPLKIGKYIRYRRVEVEAWLDSRRKEVAS